MEAAVKSEADKTDYHARGCRRRSVGTREGVTARLQA